MIYNRRLTRPDKADELGIFYYPFVHAKPDGSQIEIISEELFEVGGTAMTPILRSFLRRIHGRIFVEGDDYAHARWIP